VRIVLDTACFVTAVRSSDGAAGEVVRKVFREEIVPLMDLKLGLEYRDVALRPEHLMASALSEREVLELIEALEAFAEAVEVVLKTRPLSSDPNDDMVLDLAINGRAEALVTYNTKHFLAGGKQSEIPILTPAELLQRMSKGKQYGD
jgi:putative PIN family toxin of toxin-antitoxin system